MIAVLDEAVLSGSENQLKAVASILREVPQTFVWDQADFVKRALCAAARCGEESVRQISGALFSSTTSEIQSGRPGQSFSEDREQRDRSAELAKTWPPGTVEARFYRSLERDAAEIIQWSEERGEQMMDWRDWEWRSPAPG